ncbi:hypothetical protein ABZ281_41405, partial [Streptomyces sp. NPDC006265]|uniref:SCO4983 family protein n=1 Tax=Streptomyces sp. NPDC006265 TaxID=3156740 RepID=UPI0033BA55D0
MYEPIRDKSVHNAVDGPDPDFPHRSREEELDIQLAGHLAALLAVTDELRAAQASADLDTAAERLAEQVGRLRGGRENAVLAVLPTYRVQHLGLSRRQVTDRVVGLC